MQEACYRNDAELAEARRHLADLQLEQERTRGRLASQAQQIGAMEQRLAQGETESQELEKRHAQLRQELEAHLQSVAELEAQIESARERLSAKAAEREQIQQALQARAKTLETGRQNVLRLLGESSALKNQLVQIGEYLSAIDRDAARCQRDEQTAGADLERLAARESGIVAADVGGADGTGIHRGQTAARGRRAERAQGAGGGSAQAAGSIAHRCIATESPQGLARRDSFASRLYGREREAIVYGHRARRGRGVSRGGRAGGFRGSGAGVRKGHRRVPARRAGIRGGGQLERCRARDRPDAHRSGRAGDVPGASGSRRTSAGSGIARGRRRRDRPVERSSAVHQWLRERAARFAAAAGALFPGRRSRRRRSGWPRRIPSSSSCCRMASAITATR